MAITKQTSIGAFVLGGIILALAAIILFGNFNLFSSKKQAIVVFPGSVTGLSIGAPVNFRGVQVGTVNSITLQFDPKDHQAYIPVVVSIDPKKIRLDTHYKNYKDFMDTMIANGLRAEISTESFVTGSSNIFLDFYPNDKPIFHPQLINGLIEIPSHPSTIQQIKSELMNLQLEKLSNDLNETILKVGKLADTLNEQIPPLLNNVTKTSESSNKLIANVDHKLDKLFVNLNTLLIDGDQQIKSKGAEIHKVLINTNKTLSNASDVLQNLKSMTSVRSTARNNLEIILQNLADAATSLRGFSTQIERNPKILLTGRRQ
ncbi:MULTISPECIES: MlaD family protein [Commensalibacter]|uniref:Mammalian cell entry domain-containing protein n=2 Tax=Commensalibacter TaxID=1079922 RepID=W7DYQ2_9PROT|nr:MULTISPECIES: MlaD family protein [Commensalibacter]EUK17829.1 mammalian cell entry domain-containing protein [Commensalibacter papalotli (ex Servin-Garciduenas et al. 2014)]CAI3943382.1 Periplasmic subunit MlaD of the ABC-type intermembrane phospholipid transporter Mla (MlaD) (PDB:5UW8) [Commensalibacter papalotli (ex Botero et al. 2024)]CAI3947520.1 Periplasmic subunit MlaD of the ABC-type intermembrane phospholipid transporter Mla (MlaD) (PDB:5UW8) [Commensalibacter papalotli (ex Botero et